MRGSDCTYGAPLRETTRDGQSSDYAPAGCGFLSAISWRLFVNGVGGGALALADRARRAFAPAAAPRALTGLQRLIAVQHGAEHGHERHCAPGDAVVRRTRMSHPGRADRGGLARGGLVRGRQPGFALRARHTRPGSKMRGWSSVGSVRALLERRSGRTFRILARGPRAAGRYLACGSCRAGCRCGSYSLCGRRIAHGRAAQSLVGVIVHATTGAAA